MACAFANYGETGYSDLVDGPGGSSSKEVEAELFDLFKHDMEERLKKAHSDKAMESREKFLKEREQDWMYSYQILRMIQIVETRLGKRPNGESLFHDSMPKTNQDPQQLKGKAIICSEFLCALDVAFVALTTKGYKCLRHDLWQKKQERKEARDRFLNDDNYDILLMTDCSGELELKLPVASTIIHLTPCWNLSLTRQCNARVLPPGMAKIVKVFNFHSKKSIEDHVVKFASTGKQ